MILWLLVLCSSEDYVAVPMKKSINAIFSTSILCVVENKHRCLFYNGTKPPKLKTTTTTKKHSSAGICKSGFVQQQFTFATLYDSGEKNK